MRDVPYREAAFGPVEVELTDRPDGSKLFRSRVRLSRYPHVLTERLAQWARSTPDRPFLARRDANGRWRAVSYAETLARVVQIAGRLLALDLGQQRPVAVLSENSCEHGLLALAALHVGVPIAPISPSYSLVSKDHGRLSHVVGRLTPGLVVVSDGPTYENAVERTIGPDVEVVTTGRPLERRHSRPFKWLESSSSAARVTEAHSQVRADDVAKILFTSGSTSAPKGVINTHRMLCSNLQQIAQCFPCMVEDPLDLVDWLPWHHTFGGNHNFGLVLWTGGTLYIDDGKPTPDGVEATVQNLREISPTVYFNVPKGFAELLPRLQTDAALRKRFFSRLKLMFYAGAGLSQPIWDGLQRLAIETVGTRIVITSGLGCTESAPSAMFAHWAETWSGLLGVPVPGLELKLTPVGDKWEARYRGPNVTPGYFRQPEATVSAFDEEGFYRTGDAVRFVDATRPSSGMLFDGRLAEDFKLSTGTWVSVGAVRASVIEACAPLVADAVLTGLDQECVGAILFPSATECRQIAGLPEDVPLDEVVEHPKVLQRIAAGLETCAARSTGSASRVLRAAVTPVPATIDSGEMTDKGSLNQRAVLDRRRALVEGLHATPPGKGILVIGRN
jgi:feruloyl-CoA synthase